MENAFLILVKQGIDTSFLLLAILTIRLLFRRMSGKFRYVLWAFAAFALIIPSTFRIPLRIDFSALRNTLFFWKAFPVSNIPQETTAETFASPLTEISFHAKDFVNTLSEKNSPWLSFFSVLWLSCCIILWIYMLFSQIRLYKILRVSLKVKENYRICDQINDAFVFGLLHPCIYLPSGLNPEYLASILAHERMHVQRKDYLWKLLGYLLLSIYCFHPLVWVSYILFCKDIELACDETVIQNMSIKERAAYSHSLLYFSTQNHDYFPGTPAFGKNNIKERIQYVMNYKRTSTAANVFSLALCFLLAVLSVTKVQASPEKIYTTEQVSGTEVLAGDQLASTACSFGFENLSVGEMEIYPETIDLTDNSGIAWSINYLQMGLSVEIILIDENDNELIQKIEGGSAAGDFSGLSAGIYKFAVRCSDENLKNKNQRNLTGTASFSY